MLVNVSTPLIHITGTSGEGGTPERGGTAEGGGKAAAGDKAEENGDHQLRDCNEEGREGGTGQLFSCGNDPN